MSHDNTLPLYSHGPTPPVVYSLDIDAPSGPARTSLGGEAHGLVPGLEGTLHSDGPVRFLHDERVLLDDHCVHEFARSLWGGEGGEEEVSRCVVVG